MICALILLIGCLSIIIGHKYTCIDRLLSSCMIGSIFGYILAISTGDYSVASNYSSTFFIEIFQLNDIDLNVFNATYLSRRHARS